MDYKIEKIKVIAPQIDSNGNIDNSDYREKYVIKNSKGYVCSHQYLKLEYLCEDHFAVLGTPPKYDQWYAEDEDYVDKLGTAELKWGVIRINRDSEGNIIPNNETFVFPCLYEWIYDSNFKTAMVGARFSWAVYKQTYLDLDINKKSYGHQLLPCLLDETDKFEEINDKIVVACCMMNGSYFYIPRNMPRTDKIEITDLLQESEIELLYKSYDETLVDRILNNENLTEYELNGKKALDKYLSLSEDKTYHNAIVKKKIKTASSDEKQLTFNDIMV